MSTEKRTAGAPSTPMPPGPFVARVISHLDPRRSGALKVQLIKNSSSSSDDKEDGQVYTVKYCSPFYGVTDVNSNSKDNYYRNTQQSYGFWAVPPDPGSQVLVIFAEGKSNMGYWIGCVQDEFMNHMVPGGYAASKSSFVIQDGLVDEYKNKPLPTGEYNKAFNTNKGNDPDKFLRPHNPMMVQTLASQGLLDDTIRGLTSSSARRELPSTVFGWNTPGPLDKRDGAPKGKYGTKGDQVDYYRSRLGGSAFTMDDGDPSILRAGLAFDTPPTYYDISKVPSLTSQTNPTLPFNEHVRLRTRTGHQILMHNTEDLIYIGNARGSAWIELTSNGKIDVYSDDSISVRSGNDINLHADRDFNWSAGRDININAGRNTKNTTAENVDVRVGVNKQEFIGNTNDLWIGNNSTVAIGGNQDVQVKGNDAKTVSGNYNLQVASNGRIAINGEFGSKVAGNFRQTVSGAYNLNTAGDNKFTSGANTQIKSAANHKESAVQIHMNSPGQVADGADAISDVFTSPVTNDSEDVVTDGVGAIINGSDGNPLEVTFNAVRATEAPFALYPRRVPIREPWPEHEHLNPAAHTPANTQAIESPPAAVRVQNQVINSESDQPPYTGESGPVVANLDGEQVVVPGTTGPVGGKQPAHPVAVNDMQRYFLSELIKGIGLDPEKWISENAVAVAMAMAQPQAECGFKPRSESMNYSASRLRAVYPSRVKSNAYAQQLVAAGPAAIGNTLYGNRYGNAQDEGYKYRGRGLIQLTFKSNYEKYGNLAGVDVVNNPEMANDPEVASKLAVAYIKSKSVSWTSQSFAALGEEFRRAVGYANQGGAETNRRIGIGKGFYQKIINGELTPLANLSTTEYPGTGETRVIETKPEGSS
jgi:predicted chitinase